MSRIKEIRKQKGLTQQQVADFLGVTQATFSGWENEKYEIDNASLIKLSDYFNVSIDYLMGRETPCSICGYSFVPEIPGEIKRHEKRHQKFLLAREKYGFLWNDDEKNNIKNEAYEVLYNKKSSSAQIFIAAENLCKVYFCRSLKTWDYDLSHPTFNQYVPMLLNLNHFKELFSKVYDELVDKYGEPKEGILEGMTSVNELSSLPTTLINNVSETKLVSTYRNLTPEGQKKVKDYIDDLSGNSLYYTKTAAFGGASKKGEITKNDVNQLVDELENPIE